MKNRELRKIYDKNSNFITLRLTAEEKSTLQKMMENEDWQNTSAYIKSKLFPGNIVAETTTKMLMSANKKDLAILLEAQMRELVRALNYLNHRYDYETEKVRKERLSDEKYVSRIATLLERWKNEAIARIGKFEYLLEDALKYIGMRLAHEEMEAMRALPDSALRNLPWDEPVDSPRNREAMRRVMEKYSDNENTDEVKD